MTPIFRRAELEVMCSVRSIEKRAADGRTVADIAAKAGLSLDETAKRLDNLSQMGFVTMDQGVHTLTPEGRVTCRMWTQRVARVK